MYSLRFVGFLFLPLISQAVPYFHGVNSPGPVMYPKALSANGLVVVGEESHGIAGFYWSVATGYQSFVGLPFSSVSGDGRYMVGSPNEFSGGQGSFLFDSLSGPGGVTQILPNYPLSSGGDANLISANAARIVGHTYLPSVFGNVIQSWYPSGVAIPANPARVPKRWAGALFANYEARGISGDGAIIVGTAARVDKPLKIAFLKRITGNTNTIIQYPTVLVSTSVSTDAAAMGISKNGLYAVGLYKTDQTPSTTPYGTAFVWSQNKSAQDLPNPWTTSGIPSQSFAVAKAISDDGNSIVGTYQTSPNSPAHAVLWRCEDIDGPGPAKFEFAGYNIRDLLATAQPPVSGIAGMYFWLLVAGVDISADGRTILGGGIQPNVFYGAWIASPPASPATAGNPSPPIPAPTPGKCL